jgi:sigma-B regulation protein RsbU (phosphoserine phosphatase)
MAAKILVVDDEPQLERLIRQRFRKKIKSSEYEFRFAQDGSEALDILSQNGNIDIVLTDINMPNMDGLTFLTKLDDLNKQLKAVMVSAYGDMKNIRTAMNRGAYDFVTKPIDFEDLELTINKAIKDLELLKIAKKAQQDLIQIRQELNVAGDIQQSILPKNFNIFPCDSRIEIAAKMIPAQDIGGDFYDFFMLDDTHLGIVIGDVSGKGMPAAIFMAISRTLLKALAFSSQSPHECLENVNYLLNQDNPRSMFVTLFYGILNTKTGELEYSNGGHNSPFVINEFLDITTLNHCGGCALGVTEEIEYKSEKIVLKPGNSLVLYTDGIPEAINNKQEVYSINRLTEVFKNSTSKSCHQMIQTLVAEVESFTGKIQRSDDITAMVIKHCHK